MNYPPTFFLLLVLLPLVFTANGTITFFIRPFHEAKSFNQEKMLNIISQPGKSSYKSTKNYLSTFTNEGIIASYWGYISVSDFMGKITFPRKQVTETFTILITEHIIPIFMIGNTIHHWQIDPTAEAQAYTFTRVEEDKKFYWAIDRRTLPRDNRIQLDTIVIFAKPKDIYVPLGKFETTDNPQLVLPDIFAKKTLMSAVPALWILRLRQFFGPLKIETRKISDTYYSEQIIQ